MKNALLRSTIIAAGVAFAAPAFAQQAPTTVSTSNFNARIGGFMTLGLGYVDSDAHKAEVEIVNDSEVTFNFSLTADNGLTFFAKAEIENNNDGGTTSDEYVGGVRGFFGTFEVGAEDGAMDRLFIAAAGGTAFTAVGDETGFLFDYAADESTAVPIIRGADTGDDLKVSYFTPEFAGFQAGVSYANSAEGGTSTAGRNGAREAFELGANYSRSFGDFDFSVSGGYTSFSSPYEARFGATPDDSYTVTANVGFAGFTVGAAYGGTSFKDADDTDGFAAGVNYATGPWLFGVQYAEVLSGDAEDDYGISAGVDYALAPGVIVGGTLEYADGKAQATTTNPGSDDSFAAGVWLSLGF